MADGLGAGVGRRRLEAERLHLVCATRSGRARKRQRDVRPRGASPSILSFPSISNPLFDPGPPSRRRRSGGTGGSAVGRQPSRTLELPHARTVLGQDPVHGPRLRLDHFFELRAPTPRIGGGAVRAPGLDEDDGAASPLRDLALSLRARARPARTFSCAASKSPLRVVRYAAGPALLVVAAAIGVRGSGRFTFFALPRLASDPRLVAGALRCVASEASGPRAGLQPSCCSSWLLGPARTPPAPRQIPSSCVLSAERDRAPFPDLPPFPPAPTRDGVASGPPSHL